MRNLIITTGYGYGSEELRTFLISANLHIPAADVIVFSDRATHEFIGQVAVYNSNACVIVPPDTPVRNVLWRQARCVKALGIAMDTIGKLFSVHLMTRLPQAVSTALLHVALARYIWIGSFLDECNPDIDMILLADSRDVFFQDDPFQDYLDDLVCGEEPTKIQECSINSAWLKHVYSEAWVDRLGAMPVLCSGVTLGSSHKIRSYIESMVSEIAVNNTRLIGWSGLDQAIHNKVLYGDGRLAFSTSKNGDALLATLHHSNLEEFHFDESEGLKTTGGDLVKIVHQYDRHRILHDWVIRRYL